MDPFKNQTSSTADAMRTGMGAGFETDIKPLGTPQGKRPKPKSPVATFLGSDATPGPASSSFAGAKTLMGQ